MGHFAFLVSPPRSSLARLRPVLQGKTVLITGASYGIGEATAKLFAQAGAHVVLLARTADKLEQVCASIVQAGGQASWHAVDLYDLQAVQQVLERLQHYQFDVLVLNAGRSVRRVARESWQKHDLERLLQLNTISPSMLVMGLLPSMLQQGGAQVVAVSTVSAALPGMPMWGAYQSSKASFDIWLQSMAAELFSEGLRVSSVYMPLVRTRMIAPTAAFAHVPALDVQQAAQVVAFAVVSKRGRVGAWWLWTLQTLVLWCATPVQRCLTWLFAHSQRGK